MESFAGHRLPLNRLNGKEFCFRLDLKDEKLKKSIQTLGLLQPLTVAANGKNYVVIDGHKRLAVLKQLKIKSADCFILPNLKPQSQFVAALTLNQSTGYSELEVGRILELAEKKWDLTEKVILEEVMPLLRLAPSAKVLQQYLAVAGLSSEYLNLIRSGQIPFQGAAGLAKFSEADQMYLLKSVLLNIKPSASQLAHLCEWWLDLVQIKKLPLQSLLKTEGLQPEKAQRDLRMRTDNYYKTIRALRFPDLAAKENAFRVAVKTVLKGETGLELRAPDHFEKEGLYLQAHIRSLKSLDQIEKKIGELKKQAPALFDTLL